MKRLDEAIEDEKISQDIRRLEAVCQKIFDRLGQEELALHFC